MPVYSYRCQSCGVQFERQQSFQDAPLKTCPECRRKTLVKLLTPVGIVFKGAGFYATDKRSTANVAPVKAKDGEKTEAESKPSTSTSAKTDSSE